MKQIITLLLLSILISSCAVLNDIFSDSEDSGIVQSDTPPVLELQLDDSIALNQGTYCWAGDEVGLCVDMIPPIYEADNHIAVTGETLALQFANTPPTSLSAYLHPGSNLMTRIADIQLEAVLNDDGSVSIPLMEDFHGDYVLVVIAFWQGTPSGDSMYTLPITIASN